MPRAVVNYTYIAVKKGQELIEIPDEADSQKFLEEHKDALLIAFAEKHREVIHTLRDPVTALSIEALDPMPLNVLQFKLKGE